MLIFNTSVTMDVSEYMLFAGGSNGDRFAVNMYGQVYYTRVIFMFLELGCISTNIEFTVP